MNDVFIISGINMDRFKLFMQDNKVSHICEERHKRTLKLEVLDWYPHSKEEIAEMPYLQGIEKVSVPDVDLFVIELKGNHILQTQENSTNRDKKSDNDQIHNSKTIGLLDSEMNSILSGKVHYK